MSIVDASVILIGALFGFYGLTSAVEYGIVFKMLGSDKSVKHMFTPLWEVTNVFLVFGFTALAILFNNALPTLSKLLLATLILAIVVLLVRACSALVIFYIKDDKEPSRWLVWLFGLTTLAAPLIFSSAGIYMLTGAYFWKTLLGFLLMFSCLVGLCAAGLLIVNRRQARLQRLPGELFFALWLLMTGSVLPLVVLHKTNFLTYRVFFVFIGMAVLGLGVGLGNYIRRLPITSWHLASLYAVATPIILAWSLRPYLVAGNIKLTDAYGAQTYGSAVVIGLAIMLPLISLGLYLFGKLLAQAPKPH